MAQLFAALLAARLRALLRFIDGCCVTGGYVCLESWLNVRAESEMRGSVLAGYVIAPYMGQGLGQQRLYDDESSARRTRVDARFTMPSLRRSARRSRSP